MENVFPFTCRIKKVFEDKTIHNDLIGYDIKIFCSYKHRAAIGIFLQFSEKMSMLANSAIK